MKRTSPQRTLKLPRDKLGLLVDMSSWWSGQNPAVFGTEIARHNPPTQSQGGPQASQEQTKMRKKTLAQPISRANFSHLLPFIIFLPSSIHLHGRRHIYNTYYASLKTLNHEAMAPEFYMGECLP